jgi:hypothetical protein
LVNFSEFQNIFRKFKRKKAAGQAGVKGWYQRKQEYPFYKIMAVPTVGKGSSNFPRDFESGNPA